MKSIYSELKGLHKEGKVIDFLATWKKTFDKASEREVTLFQKTYSDAWFDYETPQMSLTVEALQGKYRLRFMATLIGDESPTPLRRSDGFDIWRGEIPRVGHKFPMSAARYRSLLEVYNNPMIKETDKVKKIEKTLKADVEDAYMGCKDVMDFIALQAFSNWGVAQFNPETNNPGGRTYEVDYEMTASNMLISPYNWTNANAAAGKINPVLLLSLICSDLRDRGIEPGEILMSQDLYYWFRTNEAVRLMIHGDDKKNTSVTKSQLSDALEDNEVPPIKVITRKMATDRDGQRSNVEPWNKNFICIKPAGKIGFIQPAIEDNELMEEKNVEYMNAGNGIRIAKWRTGDSTNQVAAEYTQGSGRLIPVITDIDAIICMQVRGFDEKSLSDDENYWVKSDYDADTSLVEA